MKRQSNFIASNAEARALGDLRISNLRFADFAEGSPFAGKGYKADAWKAYVEFDLCHTLPGVWLGPVSSGDYIGFLGETLAASHASLRHQQFNYRHQLKQYAPDGEKNGKRDRIIGCIVDTAMAQKPMEGWWSPANRNGKETCIHACAVVFKLAEGVDEILGAHIASRETQSVSIETITTPENLSILRPSTAEMHPYLEMPEEWLPALVAQKGSNRPRVGTLNGEQLIVVYGGGGKPVGFRGVGMTPNPAEKFAGTATAAARITAVNCEMMAVAAEAVPGLLCGRRLEFSTGRRGTVSAVLTEGAGGGHRATPESPVVRVTLDLTGAQAWLPLRHAAERFL